MTRASAVALVALLLGGAFVAWRALERGASPEVEPAAHARDERGAAAGPTLSGHAQPAEPPAADPRARPAAEPQPAPPAEPGLVLAGRVVTASDGRPLEGARVRAHGGEWYTTSQFVGYADYGEAVSAPDGSFRLGGIPREARVTVWVELDGWSRGVVTLPAAAQAPRSEPLSLALDPAGAIVAQVLAPDGSPRAGAEVNVRLSRGSSVIAPDARDVAAACEPRTEGMPLVSGVSDAGGRVRIVGIPFGVEWCVVATADEVARSLPSRGRVTATAPQAVVSLRLRAWSRVRLVATDPDGAARAIDRVDVKQPGETRFTQDAGGAEVTVPLEPGSARLTLHAGTLLPLVLDVELAEGETLERAVRFDVGAHVEGVVVDEVGKPIAGVRVHAGELRASPASQITDATGAFRIAGLEAGEHWLRVAVTARELETGTCDAPGGFRARAPAEGLRLVTQRPGRVRFRLRVPEGAPAPERLASTLLEGFEDSTYRWIRWTQDQVVWPLHPARYELTLQVEGYAPFHRAFTLAPGQAVDLGTITFAAGVTIEGHVRDVNGRPAAGIEVATRDVAYVRALTDADGRFRLENLPARRIEATAQAEGWLPTDVSLDGAQPTSPVLITLHRGGLLKGRLRLATGAPAAGHFVSLRNPDGDARRWAGGWDAEGRYEVRAPAGRYEARVYGDGDDELALRDVVLVEGEETTLDLTLP